MEKLDKVMLTITREDGKSECIKTTDYILVYLQESNTIENGTVGMCGATVGVNTFVQGVISDIALVETLKDLVKKHERVINEYKRDKGLGIRVGAQTCIDSLDSDDMPERTGNPITDLNNLIEYLKTKLDMPDED